jgi:hypothetical protein
MANTSVRQPSLQSAALLMVMALLAGAPGLARAAQARRFPVATRGALELQIPDGWVAEMHPGPSNTPPTVQIDAPNRALTVLATPLPPPPGSNPPTPERLRAAVEAEAGSPEIRERAAEAKPAIQELRGPQAAGYLFSATDKTWKPGGSDYHYITQGEMVVGSLVVTFTILTNAASGPDRDAALEMLRSARYAAP